MNPCFNKVAEQACRAVVVFFGGGGGGGKGRLGRDALWIRRVGHPIAKPTVADASNHSESQKNTLGPFSPHPNPIPTYCKALEGAAQGSSGVTIP